MVKGLKTLTEHLRDHNDAYVILGGAACELWLAGSGVTFRATRDVDMVILLEGKSAAFARALWSFVKQHGYAIYELKDGTKCYYRFEKPRSGDVPAMIELFSTVHEGFAIKAGQQVIPIREDDGGLLSLSAILMDEDYYSLVRDAKEVKDGVSLVGPDALIPLKARAYLDLDARKRQGMKISQRDLNKHRNDVFLLAATLPGTKGPELAGQVKEDLRKFLAAFPENSQEWSAIRESAKKPLGRKAPPAKDLTAAIRGYFGL